MSIEKTEFGYTGSITDLPLEARDNPEAAMGAAFAMVVSAEHEQEMQNVAKATAETELSKPEPCVLMPTCEVCGKNQAVGVCCVPGVPYSAAYCKECLEADAHPYFIVVGNTACCGGLEQTNDEWQAMVRCTLAHLGKSTEEFEMDVAQAIKEQDAYCEDHDHDRDNAVLDAYCEDHDHDRDNAVLEALNHAAKHLCLIVHNTHTIECACDTCAAACAVVDIVEPPMAEEYRQQFERRIEVQKVAKEQKERSEKGAKAAE